MKALKAKFLERDVDLVARALIGVTLTVGGVGGIIVETESYDPSDAASHSYGERVTPRNAVMFGPAGVAYVYKIYGIHWCLNFTCGHGAAVLIRALEPTIGIGKMQKRRGTDDVRTLCSGPGKLCQALAVTGAMTGASLFKPPFSLVAGPKVETVTGVRIGLTKAVELERRFGQAGSRFLSKPFAR
ncbi:MAG TPA: DNA-3-methyladenine glycosylase [Rhizomicrobium sp.]|jgi:DNA-3-methyladenine glycosylase|nr:DNA-3-methyladenine glycosylase [Rhizomicrobium sp.]